MEDLTQTLLTRQEQVLQASRVASQTLICMLRSDEPVPAAVIAEALERRAYARWWTTLTDHVVHDGQADPAAALAAARKVAHDALLVLPTPRSECHHTNAQAITTLEAARAFFHDTATLYPPTTEPAAAPGTTATGHAE
ncbi:hypothetical protein GCM10027176_51880 [Actinoallomurus bryophytorum]|uniref:Uncharacterized protein n=2 Tax=Actinoallomurus bryophytorum TaxID=1490222 RepID=A0A543CHK6_9ACTN|nr:hypothetical protein FB559_2114 [Actinoallomurus bryophytorum]